MIAKVMKSAETLRNLFVIVLEIIASVIIIQFAIQAPIIIPFLFGITFVGVVISRMVAKH